MSRRSGLVLNEEPQTHFAQITFNLQVNKATLRHDSMEGRDYLVAPCVMLTEGVHRGSQGALYYPAEELAKTPAIWNSKPVVVYHPKANGQSVSACDPVIFDKQRIGLLMNTRFESGKLKTECWLEETKTKQVDERVLNALDKGEVMEVSTGLFTDNEAVSGEWNGEQYDAIARNYRPDHLAVLPDEKGACSVADGAGLLRNEAEGAGAKALLAKSLVATFNKLSHNDIWSKLNDKIRPADSSVISDAWVMEVWDKFFIYEKGGKTYYQRYSVKDNEVSLDGVRQEATKKTSYKLADGKLVGNTVQGDGSDKEGRVMDKEKIVNQLISNEQSPWKEEDREKLMGLSDAQLTSIVSNQADEEERKKQQPPAAPPPAPEQNKQEAPPAAPTGNSEPPTEMTVDQYIANAPEGMRDMLKAGIAAHSAEKAKLVTRITANQRNPFTAEQLNAKGLDELKALAQLAEEPKAPATAGTVPHYGGMAEPAQVSNQDPSKSEEPLTAPVMNFGEDK